MASHFISKSTLKNKEVLYRAVITQSGKNIKSKTFRRKADAKTWAIQFLLEKEKFEATGEKPCNVNFLNYAISIYVIGQGEIMTVFVWFWYGKMFSKMFY